MKQVATKAGKGGGEANICEPVGPRDSCSSREKTRTDSAQKVCGGIRQSFDSWAKFFCNQRSKNFKKHFKSHF